MNFLGSSAIAIVLAVNPAMCVYADEDPLPGKVKTVHIEPEKTADRVGLGAWITRRRSRLLGIRTRRFEGSQCAVNPRPYHEGACAV